jgi:hypothetical protein
MLPRGCIATKGFGLFAETTHTIVAKFYNNIPLAGVPVFQACDVACLHRLACLVWLLIIYSKENKQVAGFFLS